MSERRISVTVDPSGARRGIDDILRDFNRMNRGVGISFRLMGRTMASTFRDMARQAVGFVGRITGAFKSMLRTVTSLRSILSAALFTAFIRSVINATVTFEKFASTLTVVTGDFGKAEKQVKNLINISNQLGISFTDALAPFAKFFAAARGSLGDMEILRVFEAFGKASVALQLNGQEIQGVFLALQQIASKGRVSMEELRLQLAERIPGAMQLAADAMGVSIRELEDRIRTGSIASGRFLTAFAEKIDTEFGAAAEAASKTTVASINRFKNAWVTFLNDIGEGGLGQAFKDSLALLTDWLNKNADLANSVGALIGNMMTASTEFITQISGQDIQNAIETMVNGFIELRRILQDVANSSFFKFVFANEEESRILHEIDILKAKIGSADFQVDIQLDKDNPQQAAKYLDYLKELNDELRIAEDSLAEIRKPFTLPDMAKVTISGGGAEARPGSTKFVGPLPRELPTIAQLGTFNQARENALRSVDRLNESSTQGGNLQQINRELEFAKTLLSENLKIMEDQDVLMSQRIAASQSVAGNVETIEKLRKKQLAAEGKITSEINKQRELTQKSVKALQEVDQALNNKELREKSILTRVRETTSEVNQLSKELKDLRDQAAASGPIIPDQLLEDMRLKLDEFRNSLSNSDKAMSDLKDITDEVGDSFVSAFESAILEGNDLRDVIKGLIDDLKLLAVREAITKPFKAYVSNFFQTALSGFASGQGGAGLIGGQAAGQAAVQAGGGGGNLVSSGGSLALKGASAFGGWAGAAAGAAGGAYYGYKEHGTRGAVVGGVAGLAGGAALTAGGSFLAAGGGLAGAAGAAGAGATAALAAIPVWGWVALAALAIFGSTNSQSKTKIQVASALDAISGEGALVHGKQQTSAFGVIGLSGRSNKFGGGVGDAVIGLVKGIDDSIANLLSDTQIERVRENLYDDKGQNIDPFIKVNKFNTEIFDVAKNRLTEIIEALTGSVKAAEALNGIERDEKNVKQLLAKSQEIISVIRQFDDAMDAFGDVVEPLSIVAKSVEEIDEVAKSLKDTAIQLGQESRQTEIDSKRKNAISNLRTEFDKQIFESIQSIVEPLTLRFNQFSEIAQQRVDDAILIDADLAQVQKLNSLELQNSIQSIIQGSIDFARSGVDQFDSIINSTKDFLKELNLSSISPLTPQQRLQESQRLFNDTLKATKGGDLDSARDLTKFADNLLSQANMMFSGTGAFQSIFADVKAALNDVVDSNVSKDDPVVAALKELGIQGVEDTSEIVRALQDMSSTNGELSNNIVAFLDTLQRILSSQEA